MICEMHAVARLILTISRGDIRWFRFEVPDKRRPVLILGREDVLPSLAQIPVIPLSTQIRDDDFQSSVPNFPGM